MTRDCLSCRYGGRPSYMAPCCSCTERSQWQQDDSEEWDYRSASRILREYYTEMIEPSAHQKLKTAFRAALRALEEMQR